ncbi:hypothetical protein [Labilibacter marinus]|uniref:hypothetical protein n=1 Tax=Labilibacter marinus TaxID=1477105 RepID=UPI00082BFEF1|nr:hypothetical protein [Labilibacter marinus]
MNIKLRHILLVITLVLMAAPQVQGQFKKNRNKGTSKREIRKRQEEANKKSQYNKFNELQPMGHKSSQARIDMIWSYETANTVPIYAGDISLIAPSRFSTYRGVEFGGSIAALPVAPNFYIKKRWKEGGVYVASRHQIYSYAPMLYWAQQLEYPGIFPPNENLPISIGIKNELILSKPFLKDLKCGSVKQPYIIITAAAAFDYGIPIYDTSVEMMERKFFQQRSGVILGGGGFITARLQGDFYIARDLYGTMAIRALFSGGEIGNSIENNGLLRYKLTPRFSLSGGYWLTFGKGSEGPIMPIFDLTYHFGNKQGRQKGLFTR